ncbi:unnamed protein product [Miscanthus lutarioriparius]|uniref:VWFA domain-containing protein n=1 Tax=Miscanthus lutarioriparius TaxID=422564 RepID=A0A811QHU9_9POAL|nr:unnamed protein product [Miscanthus lutarioriparius]
MSSFNDDEEPLRKPGPPARLTQRVQLIKYHSPHAPLAPNNQKVVLDLKGASSAASRAPLDLVTVIDVSGSMDFEGRLDSAKKALRFIIRKLTDDDRLSIVEFDYEATRICPLRCATEAAKVDLEALVGRLVTRGLTNIQAGLDTGLSVLSQRRFTAGRAANIMLLSDGGENIGDARRVDPGDVPVHTFGFGSDHDSTLMGAISRRSLGGVYNFVDESNKPTILSETFSQILAGLVTIVAQDLELTVTPFLDEATIKAVEAGTYPRKAATDGSSSVAIQFGTLYSTEERKVVVELALRDHSSFRPYNADVAKVQYRFSFEGQQFTSSTELITIHRSKRAPAGTAGAPPPQVQAEVARLKHADSIKAAMDKADGDKLEDARNVLAEALKALERLVVDPMVDMLRKELEKLLELFKTQEIYQRQGRPAAISSIASHDRQRFTARGDAEDIRIFATQRMDTYLEQAKQDDDKPIPTADDDIKEELEPEAEAEAVPRPEPVTQEVPAAPKPKAWEGRTLSLGLRSVTAVLSLVAFSVMLSAMTSTWDDDSYGLYEPYRYGVGVNAVVCFYSIAQAFAEILRLVLAYLLISSSSAAASRNRLWALRHGKDQFDSEINIAVSFSFLGFLALSANALISMANLFSRI